MKEPTIRGREDGPLMVLGPITFANQGQEEQTKEGTRVSLCRCGGSRKKPLCDGTHRKIGFKAPACEVILVE
jgi:CDGSH-type Zn-finger protein